MATQKGKKGRFVEDERPAAPILSRKEWQLYHRATDCKNCPKEKAVEKEKSFMIHRTSSPRSIPASQPFRENQTQLKICLEENVPGPSGGRT